MNANGSALIVSAVALLMHCSLVLLMVRTL